MAISLVATYKNASGGTLTGLQPNDVVFVYPFRGGSNSKPTIPAGWTTFTAGVTTNSSGSQAAYQVVSGTSLVTGTFTNATNCVFIALRGVDNTTPIGGSAVSTGASSTVTYPALTMTDTSGSSWVLGLAGHRSTNTTIDTPPTGMTFGDSQITTGEVAVHYTASGVTSWSAVSPSVGGTSSGWGVYTVELLAAGGASVNKSGMMAFF